MSMDKYGKQVSTGYDIRGRHVSSAVAALVAVGCIFAGLLQCAIAAGAQQRNFDPLGYSQPSEMIYLFDMESDPGWSTEGAWAYGVPQGNSGDPTAGHTGTNVYGYNLSGAYENNMPKRYLTTEALDFSNYRDVNLTFWRWLGIESAAWDHADIQASSNGVDWVTVWEHTGIGLVESSWSEQTYDISAIADGQPAVRVRWGMGPTDGSVYYCGWNIDDVAFSGVLMDDLRVRPAGGFAANGYTGGPFIPALKEYGLVNTGTNDLPWSVTPTQPWLAASPVSGSLAPGQSNSVTVALTPAAAQLGVGDYTDTVVFSNRVSGAIYQYLVSLQVKERHGQIGVLDSIAPTNDLAMPFRPVAVGRERNGRVAVRNTSFTHDLVVNKIVLHNNYLENFDN